MGPYICLAKVLLDWWTHAQHGTDASQYGQSRTCRHFPFLDGMKQEWHASLATLPCTQDIANSVWAFATAVAQGMTPPAGSHLFLSAAAAAVAKGALLHGSQQEVSRLYFGRAAAILGKGAKPRGSQQLSPQDYVRWQSHAVFFAFFPLMAKYFCQGLPGAKTLAAT
eukprot:1162010-Pelagomonas_calceolata.AAC.8